MNTSTVPASAQAILPVTRWPPLTTTNAAAVAVRCIGCVNRTERIAVRSTFAVPLTGRKRTTDGALPVDTTIAGTASNGRPSASTSPSSQMRYFAPGLSVLHGVKTNSPDAAPSLQVAVERGRRAERRAHGRERDGPIELDRERRVGADPIAERPRGRDRPRAGSRGEHDAADRRAELAAGLGARAARRS